MKSTKTKIDVKQKAYDYASDRKNGRGFGFH